MAKSSKFKALKTIVRLNNKNYNAGAIVTGLSNDQEQRLLELAAIEPIEKEEKTEEKE